NPASRSRPRPRGTLHLAHGFGRGPARGPRGRAAQPTTPGAAGGGQDHTPGPHTRGIPPISRSLTQVYEQRRGMDADGRRNVRRRRKYEEVEADDGTVLRYARHPNGGGLVERTAHVHPTAWVADTAYVDPGARVGADAHLDAGAWVDRGAVVAAGARIGANAHVGPREIGRASCRESVESAVHGAPGGKP